LKIKTNFAPVFYLATLLIIPVLFIQALWLRFKTVKLPEPSGKRSGTCGEGDEISLLVIGDSAAAGVGVSNQTNALAGQLSKKLSAKRKVNWTLIANTGLTCAGLIENFRALTIQKFDYILISVGVNDVTNVTTQNHWLHNIKSLIKLLNADFPSSKVLFSNIPPMHLFSNIPQPLRWWLGERAKNFNQLLSITIEHNDQCSFLILDIPFNQKYLAEDQFHPSKHAYNLWAKVAADSIILSSQRK
jgi:lysophospholipase L1-like esterase